MSPILQIVAICAPILLALLTASWRLAWTLKDIQEKLTKDISDLSASVTAEVSSIKERVSVLEFAQKKGRRVASR